MAKLSCREQEVAILVAQGLKDSEISKMLGISMRRTGEIVASIKHKWNIKTRAELAIVAHYFGLVCITNNLEVIPAEHIQKKDSFHRTDGTQ
ncbi:LuxR C-terminal-related transcriptional regulator [Paenibacillus macerans]|uniref:Response regulator transcription factor n=1 Tax=Paenibacillus macerans TaxID=44252 RepID=A0A6N8EVG0_PAEMA|nr:LuxR C-terminal-related transcriptional regulator [Paenibacillus macerans]MBS5912623.1 response regulator transcription factor [Paenibacillus macerans]MCY7560524.1 LuxR C-terminal-related transcriptional regulator [Paenibacillus macerans]MEC0140698.1 LuxR C-terminal-related transcriptional regulator [Paenibacillus macerans]MEC0153293.1 LuxR C-terminal-related transcriptional regulator [Paenibacillus macerans]MEC0332599.1 LuxR C-terminal-related transcriptional regulator [Paenibacillus macer